MAVPALRTSRREIDGFEILVIPIFERLLSVIISPQRKWLLGLGDVLASLKRGFGGIRVLPVHPDATKPAIRVLVSATKGSGAPMSIRRGLNLNGRDGSASAEANAALDGQAIAFVEEGIR